MPPNFIYKTLDIPNIHTISTQLRLHCLVQQSLYTHAFNLMDLALLLDHCPAVSQWFSAVGLQPSIAALIIQPPGSDQRSVHTDTGVSRPALNFGIANTAATWTAFYRVRSGRATRVVMANGLPWDNYQSADLEEIARIDLAKPTLVNTKIPHAVHNPTAAVRISLSFRFGWSSCQSLTALLTV